MADTTALTADDVAIPGTTTWNEDVAPFDIAYDWKIDGKPPVLWLQRTTSELNKKRHSGLTKPGIDLLRSAGEHADVPLRLHRGASAKIRPAGDRRIEPQARVRRARAEGSPRTAKELGKMLK